MDDDEMVRYKQTQSFRVDYCQGQFYLDRMWRDNLIEGHQNKVDEWERDDWYKQVWWSGVSHINVFEWIRVKSTKNVKKKDGDGWEGREEREVSLEKTPFGKEVRLLLSREWREWECDGEWNGREECIEVWIIIKYALRKGSKLIEIDVHEWREERKREWKVEMTQELGNGRKSCYEVIPMSLIEDLWLCWMEMKMKRIWKRLLRQVRSLKISGWMEVSLLEYKSHEALNWKRCGCKMMIE